METVPVWEQRYRAPKMSLPHWSRSAPDRAVFASSESGVWQVHALDVATGERRQISDHPVGVLDGIPTRDGSGVVFWQEDTGDETGRWLVQPFAGGDAVPFLPGLPVGWNEGLSQADGLTVAGLSTPEGVFEIYAIEAGSSPRVIASGKEWLSLAGLYSGGSDLAGLSADGTLVALQHAEHGDITHPALRIVEPKTGAQVAERGDGTSAVVATAWSPVPGDQRLAVLHEPQDRERAGIWDLATGLWQDLDLDLPGDQAVVDWYPGGGAVLLAHRLDGRDELFRVELSTGARQQIAAPRGSIGDARVRPDGSVWFHLADGEHRGKVLSDAGAEAISLPTPAPPGRPFQDWRFTNDHGQEVHGWIVEPDGSGPHPVMIFVHGGPHWLYEDAYMPEVQAYVDAGFLVAMPNYRGSTGYGRVWRDALTGDPGFTDVDDVTAGLRDISRRPDVDGSRAVIAGWSWGGYITLMELGRNPGLWRAGMAGVPVGDYVGAYEQEAPALQAMDRALFGGTPEEKPDLYRRANPITYVDEVAAPVLFVIGDNDSRCPLAQALAYVARLAGGGKPHEVYRYTTGHGSLDVDEEVRQIRAILDFLQREVPGLEPV
ncbi:MAG: prolyl oligopeptidase family serine peptidase [Actinomycetota bacterium]